MARTRLAWLALITLLLAPSLAWGQDAARRRRWPPRTRVQPVSVSLVDGMGRTLPTFVHGGQTFVLGNQGQRYAVRVRNNANQRLEVVLTIDGRDAVNGLMADAARDRGYVVGPKSSVTIEGFRTSLDSVAAFRFSDPAASFAGRMGQMQRLGIIEVAAFRERPPELAVRPKAAPRGAAPSAPGQMRRRAESNLGTEFGEQRDSRVREVPFVRASNIAAGRVVLRYDDARGLMARGIRVQPDEPVRPQPIAPVSQRRRFAQPPP